MMTSYLPLYSAITKDMFFGNDEPMFILVTAFLFMLSVGLTAIVWLLISFLTALLSKLIQCMYRVIPVNTIPQASSWRHYFIHASIVLALVRLVPISVLITIYYIIWLIMTATSRTSSVSRNNSYLTMTHLFMLLITEFSFSSKHVPIPSIMAYVFDISAALSHTRYHCLHKGYFSRLHTSDTATMVNHATTSNRFYLDLLGYLG